MSNENKEVAGGVDVLFDAIDRDARTNYDLACAREERDTATREDVEAKAIALRLWESLGQARVTVEAMAELLEVFDKNSGYVVCVCGRDITSISKANKTRVREVLAAFHGSGPAISRSNNT